MRQHEYSQNSETGQLFQMLRANLTQGEFASLPQTMHEVLRGAAITFPSDDARRLQHLAQQEMERHQAAEQSRRAEERSRALQRLREKEKENRLHELQRLREKEEEEFERHRDALKKADALKREREAEEQRRQVHFNEESAKLRNRRAELRQAMERFALQHARLGNRYHERLQDDFLQFDQHMAKRWLPQAPTTGSYKREKRKFVAHWADEHHNLPLDEEQAAAVGTVQGNALVTARAGSGKTRVLTARALFLHKHCGIPASRIMLLAFNRRAASEMESRLREWLGDDIPHVMTFHALAHALVHPSQKLLYDDKNEGKQHLSEVTQEVIDEHVRDPIWMYRIQALMLEHFRADWNQIESGGYHLSGEEFLQYRYSLQHETLKGHRASNFGQKVIANLLIEHGVQYRFNSSFTWGGRRMYADFVIQHRTKQSLYIHFVNSDRSENQPSRQTLKDSIDSGKFKGTLLEYNREQLEALGESGFMQRLCSDLREHELKPRRLDPDELWLEVRAHAIKIFTRAMVTFVGRCRQRAWSINDLDQQAMQRKANPDASDYEVEFYRIGRSIYKTYLSTLDTENLEDFNGMMLKAAETVRRGTIRFERKGNAGDLRQIDYLHIDEYQDFSPSFHDLTSAMRTTNPNMTIFAVGDDWQAINGFAGSDLTYFHNFDQHFANAQHVSITRNYRSRMRIVAASNALLTAADEPSQAVNTNQGTVEVCDLNGINPTAIELEICGTGKHVVDEYEVAVARIAQWLAKAGEVALLNRTRDPDALAGSTPKTAQTSLREMLEEELRENITVDTAHSYKGLESDSVVVLDAIANHYPLIHPHWIFGQIFGDTLESIQAAELRLFYVAVSRARNRLIICTQDAKRSPFLDTIQSACHFPTLDLNDLPPVAQKASDFCEVQVFDAYEVRDRLRHEGFKFVDSTEGRRPYWSKVKPSAEVTDDWIAKAPWNDERVRIEVYDHTNMCIYLSEDGDDTGLAEADPF